MYLDRVAVSKEIDIKSRQQRKDGRPREKKYI